jgi:radical SAM protein with 4Fe4S-binding SPASM domain
MQAVELAARRGWPLFPMLTVMDSNIGSVLRVVDNLVALGCKTVYINYGIPNVVRELDTGIDASPQALARLSEQLFRLQPQLGVRFIFNREKNKIPLCHFDYETLKEMFEEEVIGTGCEAAQGNTVIVEPGGKLLGCSHWVEHPLLNIYKDYKALELLEPGEFWQRWETGRPAEFRDELRYYPYEQCADCGWRKDKKCFGGCKVWQNAGVLPKLVAFADDGSQRVPLENKTLARLSLPVLTEIR